MPPPKKKKKKKKTFVLQFRLGWGKISLDCLDYKKKKKKNIIGSPSI